MDNVAETLITFIHVFLLLCLDGNFPEFNLYSVITDMLTASTNLVDHFLDKLVTNSDMTIHPKTVEQKKKNMHIIVIYCRM